MALDQIIGAALSTAGGVIVGVFLFWWRTRAEANEALRQWYAKTEWLAERVINAQEDHDSRDEEMDHAPYVRNTCAGVQTSLANHLAEAPTSVESDVVVECERLVEKCQMVKDVYLAPSQETYSIKKVSEIYKNGSDAANQAELVKEKSEAARGKVG